MESTDLALLRILGLKGMANGDVLAGALRAPDHAARIAALVASGKARELPRGLALTPQGRAILDTALAQERSGVDRTAMAACYERFCDLNSRFKALMHRWQVRAVDGAETPNDHTDKAYDDEVVGTLVDIDQALRPLLDAIVALAPRLAPFAARFGDALAALRAGETAMMARPMIDSYHTVWFELHEELIGLSGLTRAEEAAAGRGD
jgi:pyruvate,orthophosphate dikinase